MLGRHFSKFFGLLVSLGNFSTGQEATAFRHFTNWLVSFIGAVCNFYVGFRNNMFSRDKRNFKPGTKRKPYSNTAALKI